MARNVNVQKMSQHNEEEKNKPKNIPMHRPLFCDCGSIIIPYHHHIRSNNQILMRIKMS